jgi:LysR family glycine cleavage system transcriptional activator
LELAVLPTFASHWLIPRLRDFNNRVPDVRVNMGVQTNPFSFEASHFEAAIHYGAPTWPGTSSDYLFGEEVVAVCSPDLLKKPVKTPNELLSYPLLHSTTRPDAWTRWFAAVGVQDNSTMHGVRYELHTMLFAAAAAGLGIALVPKFLIEGQLDQLGLIISFKATSSVDSAYYLVYPTELSHGKPLDAFRTWLLEQASKFDLKTH